MKLKMDHMCGATAWLARKTQRAQNKLGKPAVPAPRRREAQARQANELLDTRVEIDLLLLSV